MAVATGAVVVLTPLVVGLASFLSPLRRKATSATVRVALLEQTPDDGVPRSFPVLADRVDAWNRYPAQRVGAVYLVRAKGQAVPTAFTAKCPHAGCFIGYAAGSDVFQCPCHTSAFRLDGARVRGDAEVSPRDMDPLRVEIRTARASDGTKVDEVWVEFVDYQTGRKDRAPSV
ncbi:MAG TPA: Rieske 2Fe-2S domain-containing protein [Lacipirellulaceae bacterium]|nr:Rieske 2Fe-2S domain-containing protein [Lacipirellulaceae bacterium]